VTTYEWLLIAHLFSVFLLVAGSGAATVRDRAGAHRQPTRENVAVIVFLYLMVSKPGA
jgi:hypothetical protein